MDDDIKVIENMVKIAVNMKPKNRVKTSNTRAENMDLLSRMVTETQKKLIGYKCLMAAVKESKENKKIADRAAYFIELELKKIAKDK
jgi:hypothetical protein